MPPNPNTNAISVRGLRKVYAGRPAIDDLDLDITRGECFCLLGPNGAGKTTTIEILEGFRRRDAGTVDVLGVDPQQADRDWRARIGVVAQTQGNGLDLTVAEAIRHFARYHAAPRDDDELISAVGLQDKARTRITKLSGGQRRRLDVALGVQGRPELLFLDEPTTGMDPGARRQFWTLIEDLRSDGTSIVLTTHYLDEAAHLADRVGVIAAGRLVDIAPPAAIGAGLDLPTTVSWSEDGRTQRKDTGTPTAVVRDLLARHPGGEIAELSVHRPDLEETYLALLERHEPDRAGADAGATQQEAGAR